jgi:N-acyl-L-homoserine lactone synthetase
MQRRAFHLASLLLLLASLSPAEAANVRGIGAVFAAPYVRVLIAQQQAAQATALYARPGDEAAATSLDLQAAERGRVRTVWAVSAPVTQAVTLHAVTGSGL